MMLFYKQCQFHWFISHIFTLKVCGKLAALTAEWPSRRKTYGYGETRTHDHAFRGHLLYHWATSPYWTSRLSCHLIELEVSCCFIHYCQLRVTQLVSLVCWRPPTTTPAEMWIFLQGNASTVLMISEFTLIPFHIMLYYRRSFYLKKQVARRATKYFLHHPYIFAQSGIKYRFHLK